MASTRFTPSPTVCSRDVTSSFFSTDVSTDPNCTCPSDKMKVEKKLRTETLFRCARSSNSSNASSNIRSCSRTPYNTSSPVNWVGLTRDSNCTCPNRTNKLTTNVENNTYYTCSY